MGFHEWYGDRLSADEQLIRIRDGRTWASFIEAVAVAKDYDDETKDVSEWVYTQKDWDVEAGASLAFDDAGDLYWLGSQDQQIGFPVAWLPALPVTDREWASSIEPILSAWDDEAGKTVKEHVRGGAHLGDAIALALESLPAKATRKLRGLLL